MHYYKWVLKILFVKKIHFQPFLNHTDIKDKIGNDKNFNDFLIALILKNVVEILLHNSSKNYGVIKKPLKKLHR